MKLSLWRWQRSPCHLTEPPRTVQMRTRSRREGSQDPQLPGTRPHVQRGGRGPRPTSFPPASEQKMKTFQMSSPLGGRGGERGRHARPGTSRARPFNVLRRPRGEHGQRTHPWAWHHPSWAVGRVPTVPSAGEDPGRKLRASEEHGPSTGSPGEPAATDPPPVGLCTTSCETRMGSLLYRCGN